MSEGRRSQRCTDGIMFYVCLYNGMSRRAETAAQTSQLDPLSGPVNPINYQVSERDGPLTERRNAQRSGPSEGLRFDLMSGSHSGITVGQFI